MTASSHTKQWRLLDWCTFGTRRNNFSVLAWWRPQMETFSALLAICAENSPVPGEFPAQRPVTRNFDVFSDLRSNKRLGKQSWGWWSETPSSSLWRHRNGEYAWECLPAGWAHTWASVMNISRAPITIKWLGHFFKMWFHFWCCSLYVQYFYMKLVQYNECLVSIVDTDGLVL